MTEVSGGVIRRWHGRVLTLMVAALLPRYALSQSELCVFQDDKGAFVQVNARADVPEAQREKARCFERKNKAPKPAALKNAPAEARVLKPERYALPSEISLEGNLRTVEMNSALGPIRLRWPRAAEVMFGRTPERAMGDAARTASRALKSLSFPPQVQTLRLEWDVVFIERDPPASQVPGRVLSSCHPAWMTPPANVYVVAERIAAGCGGGQRRHASVADADLSSTLVHEIGHAVEFYMLSRKIQHEPARAEGFASWFEAYASKFSSFISPGELKRDQLERAKRALAAGANLQRFGYSTEEYGLAATYFHLMFERRGIGGILETYELMERERLPFVGALMKEFGWTERQLKRELETFLSKG